MKKHKKLLSLLLCLVLTFTMVTVGVTAYAQDGSETTGGDTERNTDVGTSSSGMEISKTATANDDGRTYTIQLEAYATGSKVITEVTEDVPTDIVLVLDQSGSMTEKMSMYSFREYTNKSNNDYYNRRHNGGNKNLYYQLDDGSYVSVSVTVEQGGVTYTKITNGRNNKTYGWNETYTNYWDNSNNLFACVNGIYQKVTLTQEEEGSGWIKTTYYVYKLPDGTTIARSEGWDGTPKFTGIDGGVLYLASVDTSKNVYTYSWTDNDGKIYTIGSSTGADTKPTDFTLYERYPSGSKTRLQALKDAVTTFSKKVAEKAAGKDGKLGTEDDVNHRMAIVGFASSGDKYNKNQYENTEVFVGDNQYTYGSAASAQYINVLQSMNTSEGKTNITKSINVLDAYGGTFTNLGMEMANGIFKANPITDGQIRNRVVVVFTDGYPGTSSSSVDSTVANNAVSQGYIAKQTTANGGYGATVYTVGIFSGADGTPVASLSGVSDPNKFMHLLSSNYVNAQSYSDSSKHGTATYPAGGDSYYLSAGDADTLNNIFQQISDQIESGGSSTTLGKETVIKDIIAPAFSLPEGANASNITVETYRCTGKPSGEYTWEKNADAKGATATVNGDQVSVTGFDFAKNYVGTVTENGKVSYRGDKLVIKFTVEPKAGFLGGNNVDTNTSAGVYENNAATAPILTFERPQVNVSIPDITVNAQEKNVYLLGKLTRAQLQEGATVKAVKAGNVTINLDPNAENYGLDTWQTEYVNISVEYLDSKGKVFTELSELKNDQTYTLKVTISPKDAALETSSGDPATAENNSGSAKINVYKPVLTFQDSTGFYGDSVPKFDGNLTDTVWKHGESVADDTVMVGEAPTLTITYTPEENKVSDGKINTKQDIAVNADVKIGETSITDYTTFLHTNCSGKTCTVPENNEFLLHVKTCQLSITKEGGTDDESYVFVVYKDEKKYSEVTISGNGTETIYELPVGTYTISEDTRWSWRYRNPIYSSEEVELSKDIPSGTITCTNTKSFIYWLNGFSQVVKNVFGKAN